MKFTEEKHEYVRNTKKYTSVTTLVGKYKKPFDKKYWSKYGVYKKLLGEKRLKELKGEYCALKEKTLRQFDYTDHKFFSFVRKNVKIAASIIKEETDLLLNTWKESNDKSKIKGTNYHTFKENNAIEQGFVLNQFDNTKYDTKLSVNKIKKAGKNIVTSKVENLYELEDGFYPEMLIWNDLFEISGQADMVFIETVGGKRYVDINDYKTNNKIDMTNFFNKMNYPLHYIDDCKYNHYRLQICMYAWLLERFGFTIRKLGFTHITTLHEFDFMKNEIELMLKDFNEKAYNQYVQDQI